MSSYNPSVNSRTACSRLTLQTRGLRAQNAGYRVNWGDSGTGGTHQALAVCIRKERYPVNGSSVQRYAASCPQHWQGCLRYGMRESKGQSEALHTECAPLNPVTRPRNQIEVLLRDVAAPQLFANIRTECLRPEPRGRIDRKSVV